MSTPLLLALACSPDPEPAPEEVSPPPDVLLVVLDTVRADRLGAYRGGLSPSRAFDALAAQGVLFEQAVAPSSWTWPSHGSLFTGLGPSEHGAHFAPVDGEPDLEHLGARLTALREDPPTLAERFAAAGYRTVSLAANPLLDPAFGLTRGFQRAEHHADDVAVLELAREELLEQRDAPLFLFVSLMSAHHPTRVSIAPTSARHEGRIRAREVGALAPYVRDQPLRIDLYEPREGDEPSGLRRLRSGDLVLEEEERALLLDLYDGGVHTVDRHLGELLTAWGGEGIRAVTSDHGEYFGEHGLWEHGRVLLDPILDVPLVVAAPGLAPERRAEAVAVQELGATLLHLAGLGEDPGVLDGSELITATAWPDAQLVPLGAPYDRGWQLVQRPGEDARIDELVPTPATTGPVAADEALRALGYTD